MIGTELVGGGTNDYYWDVNELDNPSIDYNDITVDCSGGGTEPTVDLNDLSWDCGYDNRVCLFNISQDPCEYNDLSQDSAYSTVLDEMMQVLIEYYEIQTSPLQAVCADNETGSNPDKHGGYWSPWRDSPTGADGTNYDTWNPTDTGSDTGTDTDTDSSGTETNSNQSPETTSTSNSGGEGGEGGSRGEDNDDDDTNDDTDDDSDDSGGDITPQTTGNGDSTGTSHSGSSYSVSIGLFALFVSFSSMLVNV